MIARRFSTPVRFIAEHPLTRDRKFASFAHFLIWQVTSRVRKKTVIYDWIESAKFYARSGETGLTQNIYTGLHEFTDMGFLLHFLRRDDLFVDVGANAGSYTILAGAVKGAHVCALEPVPNTFDRLKSNVRLNKIENQVQCLNIGIGSTQEIMQFTSDADTMNHALAPGEAQENTIEVKIFPLDEVLKGKLPILIKVDVEGYETPLVQGAEETMKNSSLQAVIMELNGSGSHYGWDEAQIIDKMLSFGLQPYSYDPMTRNLQRIAGKNTNSGNTLFIRDDVFVRERIRSAPLVTVLGHRF